MPVFTVIQLAIRQNLGFPGVTHSLKITCLPELYLLRLERLNYSNIIFRKEIIIRELFWPSLFTYRVKITLKCLKIYIYIYIYRDR